MNKAIIIGFLTLIVGGIAVYFIARMNVQTEWNRMNNATNAVFQRQKIAHDEMWKVIKTNMGLKDDLRCDGSLRRTWKVAKWRSMALVARKFPTVESDWGGRLLSKIE
jgi:hypothetical protein